MRLLIVLAALALAGCGTSGPREPVVGMRSYAWTDPSRHAWIGSGPRPLVTVVWYPAAPGSPPARPVVIGSRWWPLFRPGEASRNAPIEAGRHPLVLLSHGTGGSALQLMWLAARLVRDGDIVVAVNHHGNTAAEPDADGKTTYAPQAFALWGERARDLSVALDHVLADPGLAPHIDPARISAAGFSLGGTTVALLAGARLRSVAWRAGCAKPAMPAECKGPPEMPDAAARVTAMAAADPNLAAALAAQDTTSYADPRVRAAVLIAPALGSALDPVSLRWLSRPMLVVGGGRDDVAPAVTNARIIAAGVPGARYLFRPLAAHYTFLSLCPWTGRRIVPLCRDPAGTDRAAEHRAVADAAAGWLEHHGARQ